MGCGSGDVGGFLFPERGTEKREVMQWKKVKREKRVAVCRTWAVR